jgi:hypothetical protein
MLAGEKQPRQTSGVFGDRGKLKDAICDLSTEWQLLCTHVS